jgi:2-dehydro-3-deoxy-D-arabinonate dehydratase
MFITRYLDDSGQPAVGIDSTQGLRPLRGCRTLGQLLRLPLTDIRSMCEQDLSAAEPAGRDARRLPPVDGRMEVWAAGVTYRRSREARVQESDRAADVYQLVYEAPRPELFFKSAAWRVTGDDEQVAVRRDSEINVPEPELALVLNAHGELVGYTVCNDVSSRSIEGANPLYLPQAKVYLGACAVGPAIRPAWEVLDPYALTMEMTITREGAHVWQGTASTSELQRDLRDLAEYLFREEVFPDGVVLSTGTSLVPDLPFTLRPGDVIEIRIDEVGTLTSHVALGKPDLEWLATAADHPALRAGAAADAPRNPIPAAAGGSGE